MQFNTEQLQIIDHIQGPLAILANPGTGKTRSICERTIRLIEKNYAKDYQLLLITFTNKAKDEMIDRLEKRLGRNKIKVKTFHGFGASILREFYSLANLQQNFTILDESQILAYLKREWSAYSFDDFKINNLYYLYQDASNYDELFNRYLDSKTYEGDLRNAIEDVHKKYQIWKLKSNFVDLGDLQGKALEVVRQGAQQKLEQRFKYLMVDEFQDTNQIQLELVKEITRNHRNVVIVGDMRQCIYSWRGAQPQNIKYFVDFFQAPTLNLVKNYRSCTEIVNSYNNLISKSKNNMGAPTVATTTKKGVVRTYVFENDEKETNSIIKFIGELKSVGVKYNEMVILYRTNTLSKQFEDAFRKQLIPYQLIGSHSFYDRREVLDFMSLFKWLYNPLDLYSLERFTKMTRSGVGEKTLASIYQTHFKLQDKLTLKDIALVVDQFPPKAKEFFSYLVSLENKNLVEIADSFLEKYKILEKLKEDDKKEDENRTDNVLSIYNTLKDSQYWTLQEFLDHYCLTKPKDDPKDDNNQICLMTIHKAKGLEFRAVILVGMDEKILPHVRSLEDPDQLEEERRAAYVALSRAKEFLIITSSLERKLSYNEYFEPSRFLEEIK